MLASVGNGSAGGATKMTFSTFAETKEPSRQADQKVATSIMAISSKH